MNTNTAAEKNCPVCEKSYKYIACHLKNKHQWSDREIDHFKQTGEPLFNEMEPLVYDLPTLEEIEMLETPKESLSLPTAPVHPRFKLEDYKNGVYNENEDLSKYASRKIDNDEMVLKATAKRGVETMIMHAFAQVNETLKPTYTELERHMARLLLETEPARGDQVDGLRVDITERIQAILKPSFDYMQEKITHEIFSLADQLKLEIDLL